MKSFRSWMSIVACLLVLTLTADGQLKKRVAVSRFQDRTGSGYHSLGEGVSDMLATALVKSGKFSVLERQEIDRVLQEQQFGQSFMVTPETAPKVGQILGVELMVVGSVTEFGTKSSSIGGATSLLGGSITKKTARCVVDIRLVNTTTGEIVAAESKEGSESTTGFSVDLQQIDFSNTNSWDDTDIGKAAREAVNGVVELITDNLEKIPWAGKVLKVSTDGTLLMKPGSDGGVKSGAEFTIYRKGEDVKDPDTGLSMGAEESKVGKVKVIEDALKGKAAKAKILEGTDLKVGDIIREK
jgi:curli biogenesis system outer membrane secretion channel CsgG